jgi:hypothetical protein
MNTAVRTSNLASFFLALRILAKRTYHLVMTVRPSDSISSASTGRINVKFYIGNFMKICREIINLMKIGQKCPALSM